MDINIHTTFLPHDDPEAALGFYRDVLGFELRNDVGYEGMRWLTVGPPGQPAVNIVLHPPGADPGITDDERRTIAEMMAKGTYASLILATGDLSGIFDRLVAGGARRMDVSGWSAGPTVIQRILPSPTSLRTSKPRVSR